MSDEGILEADTFFSEFFSQNEGSFFKCTEEEAKKAITHRFVAAGSIGRPNARPSTSPAACPLPLPAARSTDSPVPCPTASPAPCPLPRHADVPIAYQLIVWIASTSTVTKTTTSNLVLQLLRRTQYCTNLIESLDFKLQKFFTVHSKDYISER